MEAYYSFFLLDWEKVWSKFRSLSQKWKCEKAHSRQRHDCIMYQGLWWCGAVRWMIRALTPAGLGCNSSSYLQSSSQSSQPPLQKQVEVPTSSFLLTVLRRPDSRGGGGIVVWCHQEAQFFLKALRFTARVAVSMLQVCHGSWVSTAYMMGGPC